MQIIVRPLRRNRLNFRKTKNEIVAKHGFGFNVCMYIYKDFFFFLKKINKEFSITITWICNINCSMVVVGRTINRLSPIHCHTMVA